MTNEAFFNSSTHVTVLDLVESFPLMSIQSLHWTANSFLHIICSTISFPLEIIRQRYWEKRWRVTRPQQNTRTSVQNRGCDRCDPQKPPITAVWRYEAGRSFTGPSPYDYTSFLGHLQSEIIYNHYIDTSEKYHIQWHKADFLIILVVTERFIRPKTTTASCYLGIPPPPRSPRQIRSKKHGREGEKT